MNCTNDTLKFMKRFIYKPISVGSIIPSSQGLSKLITGSLMLSRANVVVELGSGTGVFTEQIMQKVKKDAFVLVFEIDPLLAKLTQKRCPQAVVINDTALNLEKQLDKYNVTSADIIISSLPFAGFNKKFQSRLLKTIINSLSEGGEFLTFTYVYNLLLPGGRRFKKVINSNFQNFKISKPVWENFPPSVVYDCIKQNHDKKSVKSLL